MSSFDVSATSTVFFDLDGTLIDNFSAIYRCYADVARRLGLEPKSYETLRATVGGSITLTLSRLIGEELAAEGVKLFREHFPDVMLDDVYALDGAAWILKKLRERGLKTAVFTNKDFSATTRILDFLELTPLLDGVFGTNLPDMPWRKPDREYSEYVLAKMRVAPENALLVGDSPFDVGAARAAGMPVACVATGTHMPEALIEAVGDQEAVFPNLYALGRDLFGFSL
ncbi:MAG: HAD family hydrolase [Candidatus Spyradosoma sp.]